ncbi:MAG: hypothetical protein K2K97_11050 [Muribaculaceae bacterium]|nr:hypothetical protein [Muribaculaceae bacterium]
MKDSDIQRVQNEEAEYHYHLAKCYNYGLEGYEFDEKKAMLESLEAAKLGNAKAMTDMAADLSDAEDSILGYDLAEAEMWAKKAIALGEPDGYKGLYDVCLEQGNGEMAFNYLNTGIAEGSPDCIQWLAFLRYMGPKVVDYPVEQNTDEAYRLLTSVEWDVFHQVALDTLGVIYWERGEIFKAKECFERALVLKNDNFVTIFHLGELLRSEREVLDYPRAVSLLTVASEKGFVKATHDLGTMYYNGEGCERNEVVAYDMLMKAAQEGYTYSMVCLYYMLKDEYPEDALYWLNHAAAEDDEEAQEILRQLAEEED